MLWSRKYRVIEESLTILFLLHNGHNTFYQNNVLFTYLFQRQLPLEG